MSVPKSLFSFASNASFEYDLHFLKEFWGAVFFVLQKRSIPSGVLVFPFDCARSSGISNSCNAMVIFFYFRFTKQINAFVAIRPLCFNFAICHQTVVTFWHACHEKINKKSVDDDNIAGKSLTEKAYSITLNYSTLIRVNLRSKMLVCYSRPCFKITRDYKSFV